MKRYVEYGIEGEVDDKWALLFGFLLLSLCELFGLSVGGGFDG